MVTENLIIEINRFNLDHSNNINAQIVVQITTNPPTESNDLPNIENG